MRVNYTVLYYTVNYTFKRYRMNNVRAVSSTRSNTLVNDMDNGLEFIPDLDDVNEEDLQMTVASAPA